MAGKPAPLEPNKMFCFPINLKHSRKAMHFDNFTPAVRGTTRTDERPAAHAMTSGPPATPKGETGGPRRARMPPAGTAFGKAASVDPVRVHNETPLRGLRSRPWGCPGVESSRDPWYTPARVLPDPTRTVPDPPGCELRIRWNRLKKTKLFEGTLRMNDQKNPRCDEVKGGSGGTSLQ